jgi:serine/threonine-protein kinase RsbW
LAQAESNIRMRKNGLNANLSDVRKSMCVNPVENEKPTRLEDLELDKPKNPDLGSVLPFLEERIAFRMPSDVKYLDGVLDYLSERMIKMGIVGAEESEVLIALDEAIVNAIKHGNKCDPRKAVQIVAELSAWGARFTIKDQGPGFARDQVPDPTDPARLLEPSGRGLLLINHIMDEVCYNKCGNQIQMFKRSGFAQEHEPVPVKKQKATARKQK